MTPDNKIMDYVVGLEKNLLKVKEENEKLKQALREFANDENWMFESTALKEEIKGWMRKASEQEHTIVDWENYVAREKNKNHKLKSNLKIAVEALEFYAETSNWKKHGALTTILNDTEFIQTIPNETTQPIGGVRARIALSKIGEL